MDISAKLAVDLRSAPLVLVIDDDEAVASSTSLLLEIEGYRAVVADRCDSAIVGLAQTDRTPDLIVCDYHLGAGPDGVETIQMIRELACCPVPAVLVTGDSSDATLDLASDLESCRLLSKPFDGDALLAALQDLRESSRAFRVSTDRTRDKASSDRAFPSRRRIHSRTTS